MLTPTHIVRLMEESRLARGGGIERTIRVEFMVGEHGPFIEHFARETFNPADVTRRLQDFARGLDTLTAP